MGVLTKVIYRAIALRNNVQVGRRFHVGPGSRLWAPSGLEIGDDVYVGKWCTIETDGRIGNGVLIANNVGIVGRRDHDHRQIGVSIRMARWVGDPENHDLTTRIDIGDDVWIGYGATVLAPITIGRGAIIGAGSVVTSDVKAYAILGAPPAQVIGERFSQEQAGRHEEAITRARREDG